MIGKRVSQYRIIEKLGEGGMGVVYKAEDIRLRRHAALKFLSPAALGTDRQKSRFMREAQAAAVLNHPNICTVYGIQEVEGRAFIEMTYIEGRTLAERIAAGPLEAHEVVRLGIQVAEGLRAAHANGVIHRDIKPANIMLTPDGRAVIMDFGLARRAGATTLTLEGTITGTAAYMSPEQARGDAIDHRTDLWSLGIVLYEALTGRRPFGSEYEQAAIYAILNEDPARLRTLKPDVPEELERIISRLLEKDPQRRYPTAAELLADLGALVSGTPISDTPITLAAGPVRWIRARIVIPVAATVVLVVAFLLPEVLVSEPKPIAIIAFDNHTGSPEYDYLQEAIPNLLITSLEQSGYLRVTTRERLGDLKKQAGEEADGPITQDLAFRLCRMDGIEALVVGTFTRAGDVFATDVKVLDVESKQMLESASSRGRGPASILEKQIDELSRKISRGVGLSERRVAAFQQSIREVTTSSLEAYECYLKGREASEKQYHLDAVGLLRRATEIDPEFAAAYLHLARAYDPLGDARARNEAITRAWSLSHKASVKERLAIEATYAQYVEQDLERVGRILEEIVHKYPKEKAARYSLAQFLRGLHRHHEAIDHFNIVLDLDPTYTPAMNSLAYTYADCGQYEKAFEYFGRYASAAPGDANPYDSIADVYFRLGKLDQTIANFEKAVEVRPDFASSISKIWIVHAILEEYDRTIEWTRYHTETAPLAEGRAQGLRWQGYFDHWLGRRVRALEHLEASVELTGDNTAGRCLYHMTLGWIYYDLGETRTGREQVERAAEVSDEYAAPRLLEIARAIRAFYHGLSDVKDGRPGAARSHLAELEILIPKGTSTYKPTMEYFGHLLRAEILLAEGKPTEAIRAFDKARPYAVDHLHDGPVLAVNMAPRDVAARAYLETGDMEAALAECERLTSRDPNVRGRMFTRPQNYYRLGMLYEQAGRMEDAKAAYGRFLELWSEADEGLPEITDARQRLARLRS